MTPVALSKAGVPNTEIHAMSEFPLHGLGLYDDFEPWGRYSGYVWSLGDDIRGMCGLGGPPEGPSLCTLTQHCRL